jgi:hypothetical protein
LIQLLADVLNADIDDVKFNSVFSFEDYRLVILIVVVSLTELNLNDVIADKIVEISHLLM